VGTRVLPCAEIRLQVIEEKKKEYHRGGMSYFPLRLYNRGGSFSTFYRG